MKVRRTFAGKMAIAAPSTRDCREADVGERQDRKCTWPDNPAIDAGARGRGDPVVGGALNNPILRRSTGRCGVGTSRCSAWPESITARAVHLAHQWLARLESP